MIRARPSGQPWRQMLLIAGIVAWPALTAAQERLVLVGGTLLDGTGGPPLTASRIVIDSGRIACVSGPNGCAARTGDRIMDLTGRWLSPGLIDTHVHLAYGRDSVAALARFQRLRFALGITTVRDAGSPFIEPLLRERAAAEPSDRPTPHLVVSARVLPEYADRYGVALGGPLVQKLRELGADAIKLKEPFDNSIWRDEIHAAREAGIPVWGHTTGGPPRLVFTREAIEEGVSGIAHLMSIVPAAQPAGTDLTPPDSAKDPWAWHKHLWVTAEPAVLDSIIDAMIAHQVWFEPTMASEFYWGRRVDPPRTVAFLQEPPGLRQLLGLRRSTVAGHGPAYPDAWTRQVAFVASFIQRGGMVVAGSDGIAPGVDLHEEIRLIGEAAGSPMVGLLAATRNAAIALHRPDLGTVEVGKRADLTVYAEDPLGAPGATLQVANVVKGGVVYQADSLTAEFQAEYHARAQAAWRGRAIRGLKLLGALAIMGFILLRLRAWRRR